MHYEKFPHYPGERMDNEEYREMLKKIFISHQGHVIQMEVYFLLNWSLSNEG